MSGRGSVALTATGPVAGPSAEFIAPGQSFGFPPRSAPGRSAVRLRHLHAHGGQARDCRGDQPDRCPGLRPRTGIAGPDPSSKLALARPSRLDRRPPRPRPADAPRRLAASPQRSPSSRSGRACSAASRTCSPAEFRRAHSSGGAGRGPLLDEIADRLVARHWRVRARLPIVQQDLERVRGLARLEPQTWAIHVARVPAESRHRAVDASSNCDWVNVASQGRFGSTVGPVPCCAAACGSSGTRRMPEGQSQSAPWARSTQAIVQLADTRTQTSSPGVGAGAPKSGPVGSSSRIRTRCDTRSRGEESEPVPASTTTRPGR